MKISTAKKRMAKMSDDDFNKFLLSLPQRVQLIVRSGLANWYEVLAEWYIKKYGKTN